MTSLLAWCFCRLGSFGHAMVDLVAFRAVFSAAGRSLRRVSHIIAFMVRPCLVGALFASTATCAFAQAWMGYGGNAQHSGVFAGTSQTASAIHWQTPLDGDRSYYGSEVLIHYASPMVTPANTVVHGYRYTAAGTGVSQYDHWRLYGRAAASGAQVWQMDTDYSATVIFPNDWTSVYPATLFPTGGSSTGVAGAGAAGSLLVRTSADASTSIVSRLVFYTTVADFNAHAASYAAVKIDTPLTSDKAGNIYFGYAVMGSVPANLASLGTGGVAKVNAITGAATYKSVESMSIDSSLTYPAINAAPALSPDEGSVYVAVTGGKGMLVKLDSGTLAPTASVRVFDPSISGAGALLINESSASPMVGPDGHVFMGVFGNQWRESHGWMLQFDGNLSQTNASGKRYPVGAFGWDDTASVVPSTMVSGYRGRSSYLIVTKYNNYDDNGSDPGADGSNKIAVLDPTSDANSKDRQSGIPVMNEIMTVLGPHKINNDPNHPNARYEWCINSVAVDVRGRSVIINSEDGHMYRWNLVSNSITEALDLQPATAEAYTSTAIGPDGQIYCINNAILCAIGSTKATAVKVVQGTPGVGSLQDIWYLDGNTYSTESITSSIGQVASIEADFTLTTASATSFNVTAYASAPVRSTGFLYAWSYTTGQFVLLGTQVFGNGQTGISASVTTNAAQFVGPGGAVRVLVRGEMPSRLASPPFTLSVDLVTCGAAGS